MRIGEWSDESLDAGFFVAVQDLDEIGRMVAAAEEAVNRLRAGHCDHALDERNHRLRDPEPRDEHRDSRRIRHEELRGNAPFAFADRHEFAVAKGRVARKDSGLHRNGGRNGNLLGRRHGARKPDKRLVEDLHADSANVMVMIMDMEDTFNITVEDDAINTLKTVGDVVNYIEAHQ